MPQKRPHNVASFGQTTTIRVLIITPIISCDSEPKAQGMQVPPILRGESLNRLLKGAAAGAVASIVIGFSQHMSPLLALSGSAAHGISAIGG